MDSDVLLDVLWSDVHSPRESTPREFSLIEFWEFWVTNSGGGIRTPDTRIMIPLCDSRNQHDHQDLRGGDDVTGCLLAVSDPDLGELVERWSVLPDPIKAGILAMVRAALSASGDGDKS